MTLVAILGLGEAGAAIARDLVAADVRVRGFDPAATDPVDGVMMSDSPGGAAREADAVLSVNSASVAADVAESVADALSREQLFADLNTATPEVKRGVAEILAPSGAAFVDVALLGPVPGNGVHTPTLVSGAGAEPFARLFGGLGMPVTVVGGEPGQAAARKLVRSVFAKGLAAAVGEALAAGERLGCEQWLYEEIERALVEADGALLERLIEGSRRHAVRRSEEMAAAAAMLEELGVPPHVARASERWLRSLAATRVS